MVRQVSAPGPATGYSGNVTSPLVRPADSKKKISDAQPAHLAHAMGNTLSASNALFATHVPVNVASFRSVQDVRRRGRIKLR